MGRTLGLLGVLSVVSAAVIACNQSPSITNTTLGFNIAESLLVVLEGDPTLGTVILSSTAGNCSSYQAGLNPDNILSSDFLTFSLQVQDSVGGYLPLTAGTYNIVMAAQPGAGNYASSTEYETNIGCRTTATGANSGTVTVQPFNPDAGATSVVQYSVVFGYDRFIGAYSLSTCLVPSTAKAPDAGTCIPPGGI